MSRSARRRRNSVLTSGPRSRSLGRSSRTPIFRGRTDRNTAEQAMSIQGLGYVGVRAKTLDDWADFGTKFLGMQLTDCSHKNLALRMDDRKQRMVVSEDGGDGV